MTEQAAISPLLDSLTCELIGESLDVLATGAELWPMLAYAAVDQVPAYLEFDGDDCEDCLEAARAQVSQLPAEVLVYAIAYNGFVQVGEDGSATDALLVEFGERGTSAAYSAYVPYRTGRTEEEFVSGEPMAAGEEPLLFK